MPANQPDTDTSSWDRIDEHRMAHLDDQGLIGYAAVVVVTGDGEERLVLCWRDGLNTSATYWPIDWRLDAPHELVGRLPKPYAPICGRRATSSGRPCRVRVPMYGDSCARHAAIESEAHA
jgi:hypothetical protein